MSSVSGPDLASTPRSLSGMTGYEWLSRSTAQRQLSREPCLPEGILTAKKKL